MLYLTRTPPNKDDSKALGPFSVPGRQLWAITVNLDPNPTQPRFYQFSGLLCEEHLLGGQPEALLLARLDGAAQGLHQLDVLRVVALELQGGQIQHLRALRPQRLLQRCQGRRGRSGF